MFEGINFICKYLYVMAWFVNIVFIYKNNILILWTIYVRYIKGC